MPYFETDEFRAAMPDMDEASFPDARVDLAREWVEALIERVCGTSFISRTVTETVDGTGVAGLDLTARYIQSITSVSINGDAQSGYTYSVQDGVVEQNTTGSYSPQAWPSGRRNVTVTYEAGYTDECPADLKVAAMEATRDRCLKWRQTSGKPSDRATSITNDMGGTTSFSTAGLERPTGIPDVDAVILGWRDSVYFGVA